MFSLISLPATKSYYYILRTDNAVTNTVVVDSAADKTRST